MRKKSDSQKKTSFEVQYASHSRDLPATHGMLQLVRTELKAEITAGFSQVLSEVARVGVLVEEQNSRNRIVMEGLTGLWQRQDRIEVRVDDVEKLVRTIARSRT